ncbi:cytochrome P450 [Xylariomycetidae sp. FL0641]|nr:cytochrome P450 [Xylariomycetidae sp. FL0641]
MLLNLVVAAIRWALVILGSYYLFAVAYRVLLHPLKDYPGPVIAQFTDWYGGFHALSMRLPSTTYQDHKKYGRVMRHGPNRLVFNSAQALQDIYTNERTTKSHVYQLTIQANGVDSIFNAVDRKRHATKRRLIGRAVTDRAMRAFEPVMHQQIDIFLQGLSESARLSVPVDMTQFFKRLGLDIVGHLAFGFALNTQTDPTYRFIIDGIAMGNYRANCFMQLPVLKNRVLDSTLHLLSRSRRLGYLRALQHMISTRLGMEKHAKQDLYSSVADCIDADGPDSILLSELWSEAVFFFPAGADYRTGGDTTATALSALFYYLSTNPDAYRKLAQEIRTTFTNAAEIRGGPKLAGCEFLRACIDETLRMSPPVSGTLWRELAEGEDAKGPFVVDGHVIPPNTQVGVNIYSLHHNEDYFPEPFTFRPERWLVEGNELHRMHNAFAAFSTGARGCAGKPMAYLESGLVAAKTMWYFDFELASGGGPERGVSGRSVGQQDEYKLRDVFSAAHDGPNLVFKLRNPEGEDFEVHASP